ncbi:MAG: hypothetical protein EOO38_28470 [Cytophagaceae bacterium]|nr:MAG: hypothetical protein EOO38_28470 [Cytophagaceae bacterium]
MTKAARISSARFFVNGMNLWTKTDYMGDPEVNTLGTGTTGVGNIAGGVDFYTIPQPKTITVGSSRVIIMSALVGQTRTSLRSIQLG